MNRLSIILCKYNTPLFEKCLESIKNTVHGDYELIVIDNTNNEHTIFTAYNEGIKRSTGDILCFMHEDVICHEQNWDKKVVSHFKRDTDLGMIGVAGGASYHKFAWSWNQTYYKKDSALSLATKQDHGLIHTTTGFKSTTKQVLIVDGLWFCIKKSLLEEYAIRFDTENYKGFHRYDYDISMQIAEIAKIKVVDDIKLEHLSSGNRDKAWMEANIAFQNKWKNKIPCAVTEYKPGMVKLKKTKKDIQAFFSFIILMDNLDFSRKKIDQFVKKQFYCFPFAGSTHLKLLFIYVFGFKIYKYIKKLLMR